MHDSIDEAKLREAIEQMSKDHVVSGSPGPLFNAGWAAACQMWAKKLAALIDRGANG